MKMKCDNSLCIKTETPYELCFKDAGEYERFVSNWGKIKRLGYGLILKKAPKSRNEYHVLMGLEAKNDDNLYTLYELMSIIRKIENICKEVPE